MATVANRQSNNMVKFKDYVLCCIKKKKLPERHVSRENLEETAENYQSAMVVAAEDDFEVAPLPNHKLIQSGPLLLPQTEGYQLQDYTANNNILAAASMSQSEEAVATQSSGVYDWNMLKQSSSSETEEAVARQSGGINNFNMLLTESSSMVEVATMQSGWINHHLSLEPLFAWPECDKVDSSVVTLPHGESIGHNHSLTQFEGYDHQCQEYASSGNKIVSAASIAESTEQVPIQSGWIDDLNMLKEMASVPPFTCHPEYHTLDTTVALSPLPPLSPLLVGGESGTTLHCGENEFECQEQWSRASKASMAADAGSINCSDWGQSYAEMLKGFQQDPPS
ncbi:unnamed protein product [Ilex paraguariensis]|uniref:Uncharacterized protein n=1 Tax=Ilex paraguariensis TaxID=185542 RepID=A0ABC8T182_9AQUA